MAAIDPTAEPEYDDVDDKKPPRATLKIIRIPGHMFDDEDDSEDDDGEDEDDLLNG
jgi:FK506-binding nuclear protein